MTEGTVRMLEETGDEDEEEFDVILQHETGEGVGEAFAVV